MKNYSNYIIFILGFFLTISTLKIIEIEDKIEQMLQDKVQQTPEINFIWNDDEESIPRDGSLIRLEFTDSTGVYIGPYLAGNKQYIIELEDDIVRITDPETERLILVEKINSGSALTQAIIEDNQ